MKRLSVMLSAMAVTACSQEQAAAPTPRAAPPAPVYAESWFTGGDGASTLSLHDTQYGLKGRLIDTTGKIIPVRNIAMTETALSFIVPSLDVTWTATKTPEGGWTGKWTEGDKTPEHVVLTPTTAPATTPSPDGSTPRFIKLPDGREMFLNCIGAGAPAVIFDSGAGSDSSAWPGVREEVGKTTLSCTYDRAGLGLSDPGPLPRDTTAVANDIEAMLTAAGIPGPYILVGHSLGSYHVRQFANTRFDKMAGMVLVDPSGDGQSVRIAAVIPEAYAASRAGFEKTKALDCVGQLRARFVPKADPLVKDCLGNDADGVESYLSEVDSMAGPSTDELTASHRKWNDMPLLVLTRGDYDIGMPPEFKPSDRDGMKSVWLAMHSEMAALSSAGQLRTVPGAGHSIQRDKPQAVIDAVNEVVAAARAPKP
jgi:pimeloyl-ACP methyl ester carboxylesterase